MNTPVSYELAILLKTKGFEQDAFKHINKATMEGTLVFPSIAEVIMWLYEKHNIWISISCPIKIDPIWFFSIHKVGDDGKDLTNGNYKFNSPTEAFEAAIKYCLEKCI